MPELVVWALSWRGRRKLSNVYIPSTSDADALGVRRLPSSAPQCTHLPPTVRLGYPVLGDHLDGADDVGVQLGKDPVLQDCASTDLVNLVLIEEGPAHLKRVT